MKQCLRAGGDVLVSYVRGYIEGLRWARHPGIKAEASAPLAARLKLLLSFSGRALTGLSSYLSRPPVPIPVGSVLLLPRPGPWSLGFLRASDLCFFRSVLRWRNPTSLRSSSL